MTLEDLRAEIKEIQTRLYKSDDKKTFLKELLEKIEKILNI